MAPAVSVLLPFKNTEEFIRAALQSLVSQTFEDFEVIDHRRQLFQPGDRAVITGSVQAVFTGYRFS